MGKKIIKWSEFLAESSRCKSKIWPVGTELLYDSGELPAGLTSSNVHENDILNLQKPRGLTAAQVPGKAADWLITYCSQGGGGEGGASSEQLAGIVADVEALKAACMDPESEKSALELLAEVDAKITELQSLIDGLEIAEDLTEVSQLVGNVSAELDTLSATVGTLSSTVGGHTTTIGTLQSTVGSLSTSLSTLQSSVSSLQTALNGKASASALTELTTQVSSLSTSLTTLSSTLSTLQATVGGHTTSIASLQASVAALQSAVTTLQSSVSGHDSDIQSLSDDMASKTPVTFDLVQGDAPNNSVLTIYQGGKTILTLDFSPIGESVGKIIPEEGQIITLYEGGGARQYLSELFSKIIIAIHRLENLSDKDLTDFGEYDPDDEDDDSG